MHPMFMDIMATFDRGGFTVESKTTITININQVSWISGKRVVMSDGTSFEVDSNLDLLRLKGILK